MDNKLPDWAVMTANPTDYEWSKKARLQGTIKLIWPDKKELQAWTRQQGWKTSWLSFESQFVDHMFANQQNFAKTLQESGMVLLIPRREVEITAKMLQEIDEDYARRNESGRPTHWSSVVADLRAIRRAVEAGVVIKIAGQETRLQTWQGFYEWAHGRYHMLEDGFDQWIGNDDP